MQNDVFISYSSSEYNEAKHTKNILTENGFSCWMAPESIPAGSDYSAEIEDAIRDCGVFVLMLSAQSQQSIWVPKELGMALSFHKTVLPFHIDASDIVKPFTFHLTNVQRIEAYENISAAYEELVCRIRAVTGKGNEERADKQPDTEKTAPAGKAAPFLSFGKTKKTTVKTAFIKTLTMDIEGLQRRMPEGEGQKALKHLYEAARFSDPVSSNEVFGIESQITVRLNSLRTAVLQSDSATVVAVSKDMELLIQDRNRILKASK